MADCAQPVTSSAPDADPVLLSKRLLDWGRVHVRRFAWREHVTPYRVWVAAVMLQQTRLETVLGYFDRFMQAYPDVGALAAAPLGRVLKTWEGLGYYARARNLHAGARLVMERHGGEVPSGDVTLRALPGVGPYVAAAIRSIAFGQDAVIVDGNVVRLASRLFALQGQGVALQR
jgi:A/G-specific adenine glycosylase